LPNNKWSLFSFLSKSATVDYIFAKITFGLLGGLSEIFVYFSWSDLDLLFKAYAFLPFG